MAGKPPPFSHVDEAGRAVMVDVSGKPATDRVATASARVLMRPETLERIMEGGIGKGNVIEVARLAGIMAAKRTGTLIPLCHPLGLDVAEVDLTCDRQASAVEITATCRVHARTGVEMEALTAAAVAALTVYDMCKAVDRAMRITDVRLVYKAGGRSGVFEAR